jgi:hypothetical protein
MKSSQEQKTPEEIHRQQTWLEIWLPLILCLAFFVLVIIFLILAGSRGSSSIAEFSAISVIMMIIPILMVTLFFVGVIILLDVLVIKGNHLLPKYGIIARNKVSEVAVKVQQVLLSFVGNILTLQSNMEAVRQTLASIFNKVK